MKKITLIFMLVVFFASCKQNTKKAEQQITTIVDSTKHIDNGDKNNPQSILYALQKLAQFHNFQQLPTDAIVDSLSSNGKYVMYHVTLSTVSDFSVLVYDENEYALYKEKYVGKEEYIDEYDESYEIEIKKHVFYIDTIKKSIVNTSICEQGCAGNSSKQEYCLLNSAHKVKLIWSNSFSYLMTNYYINDVRVRIYDFDSSSDILSLDSVSTELFSVCSKDFFIKSTPDSLVHFGYTFLITCADKGIAQCLLNLDSGNGKTGERSSNKELKGKQWLKGNIIDFYFDNGKFTRSEPYFDNKNNFFFEEDE